MRKTLYGVYHEYSVDGGFGDAIYETALVGLCYDKSLAEKWAKVHDINCVYDRPYSDLECGSLAVCSLEEIPILTEENFETENPWKGNPWALLKYLRCRARKLNNGLSGLSDWAIESRMEQLLDKYPNITDEMINDVVNNILKEKEKNQ